MAPGANVCLVPLSPSSPEYQGIQNKFATSGGNRTILTIERVQNQMLYRTYIVRKQEMDRENGRTDNERQLWHGTNSKNIKSINEQGFNRSFCGANGKLLISNIDCRLNNVIQNAALRSVASVSWT